MNPIIYIFLHPSLLFSQNSQTHH